MKFKYNIALRYLKGASHPTTLRVNITLVLQVSPLIVV